LHNIAVHVHCDASKVGLVTVNLEGSRAPLRAGREKSHSNQVTFFVLARAFYLGKRCFTSVRKEPCWWVNVCYLVLHEAEIIHM